MKHVQKRSRETRERILATAKKLFQEEGYEQTSTDRIAAEARTAKGSIFAHFGDKANLLAAIGSEEINQLLDMSQASIPDHGQSPLVEAMMQFYQPWLKFFLENPDFTRLYFNQSGLSKGPWTETFVRSCLEQENLIVKLIEESKFTSTDNTRTAKFYGRGAQAFFFQVVSYRINGWIENDEIARVTLSDYLHAWLEPL